MAGIFGSMAAPAQATVLGMPQSDIGLLGASLKDAIAEIDSIEDDRA